jgi:hypothetical protein
MVLACSWKLEERRSELGKITYSHPMTDERPLRGNPTSPVMTDREVTATGYVALTGLCQPSLD